jgi:hypothetical protein
MLDDAMEPVEEVSDRREIRDRIVDRADGAPEFLVAVGRFSRS